MTVVKCSLLKMNVRDNGRPARAAALRRPFANPISKTRFTRVALLAMSVIVVLNTPGAQAASTADTSTPTVLSQSAHELRTPHGVERFELKVTTNVRGEREVVVIHHEHRKGLPDVDQPVLIGRDLDGNGRFDAWFSTDKDGLFHGVERDSHDADGWDTASKLTLEQGSDRSGSLAGTLFEAAYSRFTFSGNQVYSFMHRLGREQIDLEDLSIRARRMAQRTPRTRDNLRQAGAIQEFVAESWGEMVNELQHEGPKKLVVGALEDIGAYLLTAGLARGGAMLAERAVVRLGAADLAERVWVRYLAGMLNKVAGKVGHGTSLSNGTEDVALGAAIEGEGAEGETAARGAAEGAASASHALLGARISSTLQGVVARERLQAAVMGSKAVLKKLAQSAASQWKYITITQSLQLIAEVINRRDTLYSSNPIVMTKNILSDKDLVQNLAFMTLDSTLQTGVSASMTSVPARMAVCAVVSFVDSMAMNLLIKKETDTTRNVLDTGWESIIGNGQTQVDLISLGYFERMATRQENPRLKLVGYAITMVDQFGGYVAYGKLTETYEAHKKEHPGEPFFSFKWIPIFAPKAQASK